LKAGNEKIFRDTQTAEFLEIAGQALPQCR